MTQFGNDSNGSIVEKTLHNIYRQIKPRSALPSTRPCFLWKNNKCKFHENFETIYLKANIFHRI